MMRHKPCFFKTLPFLIAVSLLGACGTTKVSPITQKYTAAPPQKGLVAFRVGLKTINPDNHFIDVPIQLSFNGANEAKTESILKKFTINSSKFEQVSPDYKKGDYIIELEAGEYSTHPATVFSHYLLTKQASKFNVKNGKVTYIGQYDIETTIKGKDLFSRSIRKKTSHARDQKSENVDDILAQYPNVEYSDVLKQPMPEGKHRMKFFAPAQPQYIYVPPVKYKKYVYTKK